MPPAGHALWAEVGGGITFVTSGEKYLTVHKTALQVFWDVCGIRDIKAIYASLSGTGPVSMVIMHVWFIGIKGHFGGLAGKSMVRPLFILFGFFCLVGILGLGFGV